ncbi:MAG: hypothetical protein WCT32_04420 [Patescibacteria group bacterium]|jgi:hypothetical protein
MVEFQGSSAPEGAGDSIAEQHVMDSFNRAFEGFELVVRGQADQEVSQNVQTALNDLVTSLEGLNDRISAENMEPLSQKARRMAIRFREGQLSLEDLTGFRSQYESALMGLSFGDDDDRTIDG